MRARSRSIALLHFGIFHSNSTSGLLRRLRQVDLDAVAGGLDVSDVDQSGQRRRPETRDRPAAGIERQMIAGALVVPARRHHPGVIAVEIALLRPRSRGLVPGMIPVDRDCPADLS